jgi:flagella basal body P-ring formation protein FlgA
VAALAVANSMTKRIFIFSVTLICLLPLSIKGAYIKPKNIETKVHKLIYEKVSKDLAHIKSIKFKIDIKNRKALDFIPANARSFKLDINPDAKYLGHSVLPILFYDSLNKLITKSSVNIQVQAITSLFIANRSIPKGTTITEADILIKKLDLYAKPYKVLLNLSSALGKEARWTIAKDTILTQTMITDTPDIRKLSEVALLYKKENLELKIKAIALDNGIIGDTIRVRCLYKNKIFKGEVIDSQHVKVNIN